MQSLTKGVYFCISKVVTVLWPFLEEIWTDACCILCCLCFVFVSYFVFFNFVALWWPRAINFMAESQRWNLSLTLPRRGCKIFASGVNFSKNNVVCCINESKKLPFILISSSNCWHTTNYLIYKQKMPQLFIFGAFTLLIREKTVVNYALLRWKLLAWKSGYPKFLTNSTSAERDKVFAIQCLISNIWGKI